MKNSNVLNVLVVGSCEKAQSICRLIRESYNMGVVGVFKDICDETFPVFADWDNFSEWYTEETNLPEIHVIIDCSDSLCCMGMLSKFALTFSIPAVITTTGFSSDDHTCIDFITSEIPILFADENTSNEALLKAAHFMANKNGKSGKFDMNDTL